MLEEFLKKASRTTLLLLSSGFVLLVGIVGNNVYADSQKIKTVAYQAKGAAETAQLQVADLRGAIQEIKISNETFRKEYREDQRDVQNLLKELIRRP